MEYKILDKADSSYEDPIILEEEDIEDAGIMETNDGECALMLMVGPSENGTELCIGYRELKEIIHKMETEIM